MEQTILSIGRTGLAIFSGSERKDGTRIVENRSVSIFHSKFIHTSLQQLKVNIQLTYIVALSITSNSLTHSHARTSYFAYLRNRSTLTQIRILTYRSTLTHSTIKSTFNLRIYVHIVALYH